MLPSIYIYIYILSLKKKQRKYCSIILITLSSLPGKFKCSAFEWFSCLEGISPSSCLTGPNNTIYIYIYIYIGSNLAVWKCTEMKNTGSSLEDFKSLPNLDLYLAFPLNVQVIKWNENYEKVSKYSNSVGSVLFQICVNKRSETYFNVNIYRWCNCRN